MWLLVLLGAVLCVATFRLCPVGGAVTTVEAMTEEGVTRFRELRVFFRARSNVGLYFRFRQS